MKLLLKIISPIIASVLGVLLTNSFNLFDVIPFVPKEESFGLCIMVYFPIIDVIFNFIFEQFYKSLVDKFTSRLTATITSYNTNVANCENLSICFDRHDLAEAKMNVEIDGLKKHFKNTELVIYKPVFAEIQIDNSSELVITESDCLRIKLDKLFNQQNYVKCKQTFKFSLIQDPVDGDTYFDIIPKLENKKLNLIYKHNKATIKAVAK
ncbi:MAG: hypothetical protein EGR74_03850 [Ruminiclostridium sp.]|nr:hypothetical protein [Ruminiclostridium sp.]MBE5715405.1 hypothetical protein [Ruminiclostridium sp.]